MTMLPWPSPDDATEMPVDQLGMRLLWRIVDRPNLWYRPNFFDGELSELRRTTTPGDTVVATMQEIVEADRPYVRALAAAWEWLIAQGLLARDYEPAAASGRGPEFHFVTQLGREVSRHADGLDRLRAVRRLDVELHPSIAGRMRSMFLQGEFEAAVFAAMREVEITVRRLAGAGDDDVGVNLMRIAFRPQGGALTDATLPTAEQEATMALFRGAMGVFKNPASHRQVHFEDPTEAAEIVLFASLLLRMLDRVQPAQP